MAHSAGESRETSIGITFGRRLFADILRLIDDLRPASLPP